MLIFKNDSKYYIFIHIPKNSGKYLKNKIISDTNNEVVKSYWSIINNFDLAHIPYVKINQFIESNTSYNYFTYSRNPYDRIISAYFYRNKNKNKLDFKEFVKKTLTSYDFSLDFESNIIHYYPQYLFICDENLNLVNNIKIDKLDNCENPKRYILKEYFDNECIDIINEIYKQDFLLFDYDIIQIL
jgi:chondroitin 4-sulfotransferase 11